MSRRRSARRGEGQNIDSLLDTMANVVGILIMLVAVAQLAVGEALERIAEGALSVEMTPASVEAAEREREEVEEAIVRARGELEAMEATALREGLLLEVAEPLLEKLEGLSGPDRLRGENPEALAARVAEQGLRVRELEQSLAADRRQAAQLDALLTGLPTETRPKIARLPDPRPPPRNKRPLVFLCRYGRVSPVDGLELREQLTDGIRLALGRVEQGYSPAEREWVANFFDKHRAYLGSEDFYWSFQDEDPRSFFAGLSWREEKAGDSLAWLRLGHSRFAGVIAAASPGKRFVQFWVWPDSFEVYLEARYLAEASGFSVAWHPVEGRHPVGVQLLGPTRTQVLID